MNEVTRIIKQLAGKKYPIKVVAEYNKEYILIETLFASQECLEYALEHHYNIKFDCCNWCDACRELCKYQESGFNIKFKYEQVKYEGLLLEPKVIAYCTKEWNDAV